MAKNVDIKKSEELSDSQIIEETKNQLVPIHEGLIEKKITIDEAKNELNKVNEWLQWTKLEQKDKNEIWKAFDKLNQLEKNIDENILRSEVQEIINLLESLTKKDLASLKQWIQQNKRRNTKRPAEVQEWIDKSGEKIPELITAAKNDKNRFVRKFVGPALERAYS